MTKEQFFHELANALRKLPQNEREEIMQDFAEHFAIGDEEGKSEEEIISALGSPQHIGKEMVATYHLDQVESQVTTGNILRAVWAVIGLSFFNLVIVLGPFIGLLGVLIGGWVAGIAFIASPLLVFVNVLIYPGTFEWFDLFFSIGLCGLGLFIAIGLYFATKGIVYGFVRYLKFNINLVKGGLKA